MKKALIAGAGVAVLAAMPIVSVFATGGPFTDTLKLTIAETCVFSRGTTTNGHGVGDDTGTSASWGNGAGDPAAGAVGHVDTFVATVAAADQYDNLATSTFNVVCNDPDGYEVAVSTNGFTGASTLAANYPWNYVAGGVLTTTGGAESNWTIATDASINDIANNKVLTTDASHRTTDASGITFNVTYKALVDATQPADTYTATAQYTLTQLPNA